MTKHNELIQSEEYWLTYFQTMLFESISSYLEEKKMSKTDFAKEIGVSKGYITQVLNGDFNHRISTFVKLALATGKVPNLELISVEEYLESKKQKREENKILIKDLVVPPTPKINIKNVAKTAQLQNSLSLSTPNLNLQVDISYI